MRTKVKDIKIGQPFTPSSLFSSDGTYLRVSIPGSRKRNKARIEAVNLQTGRMKSFRGDERVLSYDLPSWKNSLNLHLHE